MLETGTILQNRYRIDKQIGQGGMGNVYVATDERFNSIVAIKETIFEDKNLRKAFEREARLLNSLKHSALPRVSDHFDENEGQFLVMEFISGEDLAEMMEKSGESFPLETALNWAQQLCEALEYLHAQDIIHRDIKPQNLKLTTKGQIVLLDFGLAKGNPTDSNNQTAAKSIFGFSRNYASLEQIQGAGTEPRSDLYSLSATLYHLLTGIPPADALTRAMNVLNKQSDPLIPANLVNRNVPSGVAEVLQRAMALNANERPESAAAMWQMLDESDKTIDSLAGDSVVEKTLSADFLTQETKIMGAATNAPIENRSEVKTKVAAANVSQEHFYKTNVGKNDFEAKETVAQLANNTQSPKRFKSMSAAVLGGLVLVGSVFSAGYFLSSNLQSFSANVENTNASETNKVLTIKTEEPIIANANTANTHPFSNKDAIAETKVIAPIKPLEPAKNVAKQTKKQTTITQAAGKNNKTDSDTEDVVVNDETVQMGDMLINEKGIWSRKTGKPMIPMMPMRPNIPPEQLKYMSPEQLRKLEEINRKFERNKKRYVIVTPTPKPTP